MQQLLQKTLKNAAINDHIETVENNIVKMHFQDMQPSKKKENLLCENYLNSSLYCCGCSKCMHAFFAYFDLKGNSPQYRNYCCRKGMKHLFETGGNIEIEGEKGNFVQLTDWLYIMHIPDVDIVGDLTEEECKPITELWTCNCFLSGTDVVYEVEIPSENPFQLFIQVLLTLRIMDDIRLGVSYHAGGIVIFFHGKRQTLSLAKKQSFPIALKALKGGMKSLPQYSLPPHNWENKPEQGRMQLFCKQGGLKFALCAVELVSNFTQAEGEFRCYPESFIQYTHTDIDISTYTPPLHTSTQSLGVNAFN